MKNIQKTIYDILSLVFFVLFGNELIRYGIHNHTYLVLFALATILSRFEGLYK